MSDDKFEDLIESMGRKPKVSVEVIDGSDVPEEMKELLEKLTGKRMGSTKSKKPVDAADNKRRATDFIKRYLKQPLPKKGDFVVRSETNVRYKLPIEEQGQVAVVLEVFKNFAVDGRGDAYNGIIAVAGVEDNEVRVNTYAVDLRSYRKV